jgi:hypothetical protein
LAGGLSAQRAGDSFPLRLAQPKMDNDLTRIIHPITRIPFFVDILAKASIHIPDRDGPM